MIVGFSIHRIMYPSYSWQHRENADQPMNVEWGFPTFFSCFSYIFRYRTLITRWMNFRFGFPRCPHFVTLFMGDSSQTPPQQREVPQMDPYREAFWPFSMVICWNWRSCPKNLQKYLNQLGLMVINGDQW